MAHRSTHPLDTPKTDTQVIWGRAQGAGAAELTGHDEDLVSSTRTGVGVHDLVFRHSYPEGIMPFFSVIGDTAGLEAKFTAWDAKAKTATLQLHVGGVATDAAATDTIKIGMYVRNSGRNG